MTVAELLDTVGRFLRAENRRDYDAVARLLDPDVTCVTWPGGERVRGRDAYLRSLRAMYEGRDARFEVTALAADAPRGVVLAEFSIEGRRSVCVFELRDGRLVAEREYLGPGYGGTAG